MKTLLHVSLLNLARDRAALLLTFVLPIVFFSIFAAIFGGMGGNGMDRVELAVVDLDGTEESRRIVSALEKDPSLEVITSIGTPSTPLTRDDAADLVRRGKLPVAAILPEGFGETVGLFVSDGPAVELLYDEADFVAPQVVTGLLQKAAMTAAPDLMARRGIEMFEKFGGGLTPQQQQAMDFFLPQLRDAATSTAPATAPAPDDADAGFSGPVRVKSQGIRSGNEPQKRSLIAYYAAQIAVMFLLFSTVGAAGTFLEEEESGTLERLLTSRLGMTKIILSKWLFISLMGAVQVAVMFLWGWAVFGLDLFTPRHLAGFAVMTGFTAAAAAGFGLVLATACRSRGQLSGLSTLVILAMSAAGGSMIPRLFMSDTMKSIGAFTFNAWALDGYQKVFWFENVEDSIGAMLIGLWPELAVLASLTVAFLLASRLLARRWETV